MSTYLPKIKSNSSALTMNGENNNIPILEGGRSYQLSDSKVPHLLPPPSKLKPYVDRIAGEMETWPANSNLMSTSQVKPTFLQKLEAYLSRELRILGATDGSPSSSEKRLQAFREVFDYLIDDFRTYKPILSSIKQEYESMITSQKETIKSLEPLKAMLVNVNELCEQKVLNLKQNDKKDLGLAKKKIQMLDDVILTLKEEIVSLKEQVTKCQDEVEDVYTKYRDESDSKKLLIQSMNDLKYQQEDSKKVAGGDDEGTEEEDGVFLRIALKKAREDLEKKNMKLAEVMADYGDVVPRRDFEKMEIQFGNTKEEFESLKNQYDTLSKEHTALIDVHKKVVEQRDSFASDCERMRVSATPRPEWDKCALYVEGGQERWSELASGKSTGDKVDILLGEMTGQDIEAIKSGVYAVSDFFEPKGITDDVPAYLQSSEKVRNRRLGKHDLLVMIKDIWQQKMKEEGNAPFSDHSSMQTYLHNYLKNSFGIENMVIEWGYNIHDALLRYNTDSNVSLFSGVLNGVLDEDIYYDNLKQLEGLYKVLAGSESSENGGLSKDSFQSCLSYYFPYLSTEGILNLIKSAEEELNTSDSIIMYQDLFTEDDEGGTGPFLKHVQLLWREDKEKYLKEIEASLQNNTEISSDDLKKVLLSISPKISQDFSEKFTKLGFRENVENKIDLPTLLNNLRNSCVRRV